MIRSSGVVLVKNSLYNFVGQIAIMLVAIVSIPVVIHKIGVESFGLLSLIWMVVGYFSILDLGVGQANVKYLSEQISRKEIELANNTLCVSIYLSCVIGFLISIVVFFLKPLFMKLASDISPELQLQLGLSIYWISIAIPFIIVSSAIRAVPMALQRFDIINIIQVLSGLLQWFGFIILAIFFDVGLLGLVIYTVVLRITFAFVTFWIVLKLIPWFSIIKLTDIKSTVYRLLKFGTWITVSQIVSPVTRYLDRVLLVSYHSLELFAFYSVPYEAISRLQVLPASMSTTLFPAFAERESIDEFGRGAIRRLYNRALNFLILAVLPITIILFTFSNDILYVWLGGDFPKMSNSVFKLLTIAWLLQSVCYIPLTVLQAIGKPDIAAKFYLLEIPLYFIVCLILIPKWGIEGAALSTLLRFIIIVAVFLVAAHIDVGSGKKDIINILKILLVNAFFFLILLGSSVFYKDLSLKLLITFLSVIAYSFYAWFYCIGENDREAIKKLKIYDELKK